MIFNLLKAFKKSITWLEVRNRYRRKEWEGIKEFIVWICKNRCKKTVHIVQDCIKCQMRKRDSINENLMHIRSRLLFWIVCYQVLWHDQNIRSINQTDSSIEESLWLWNLKLHCQNGRSFAKSKELELSQAEMAQSTAYAPKVLRLSNPSDKAWSIKVMKDQPHLELGKLRRTHQYFPMQHIVL